MDVSLDTIRKMFIDLLAGHITRDEADRWAYQAMQADELRELVFVPRTDQDRIWKGIMYLYGIDITVESNQYLVDREDILIFLNEELDQFEPTIE